MTRGGLADGGLDNREGSALKRDAMLLTESAGEGAGGVGVSAGEGTCGCRLPSAGAPASTALLESLLSTGAAGLGREAGGGGAGRRNEPVTAPFRGRRGTG